MWHIYAQTPPLLLEFYHCGHLHGGSGHYIDTFLVLCNYVVALYNYEWGELKGITFISHSYQMRHTPIFCHLSLMFTLFHNPIST